ncbi:MAG: SDR family NAD(P)-dependent oxidoreductase [Nocardioidaceae bacterium]
MARADTWTDHEWGNRRGVLVTGGSRGVGAEVARTLARMCGDRIAIHFRNSLDEATTVRDALEGNGHFLVQGDLADPDQVRRFVAKAVEALGRIDVLINNAALFSDDPAAEGARLNLSVAESSYDDWVTAWRRTLDVNLLGTANVTYQVARHMIDTPPREGMPVGRIVTVGSRGAYRGEPEVPSYGASKAGVHAMTQSLAVALAPYGIACVGIAPGFIETDMASTALAGPRGDDIRAQSPFGRVATTAEVASAIMALCAPGAEWVSGAIVDFNGASYLH